VRNHKRADKRRVAGTPRISLTAIAAIGYPALAVKNCCEPFAFERKITVELLRVKQQQVTRSVSNTKAPTSEDQFTTCEFSHWHDRAHAAAQVAAVSMIGRPQFLDYIDSGDRRIPKSPAWNQVDYCTLRGVISRQGHGVKLVHAFDQEFIPVQ